ncbi:Dynein heavy chain domain, partial [Cinara cedri]
DLTETTNNIYDGKVPGHWISISWTSSAIGFWFEECLKRHKQIDSWIFTKKPIIFWMTGFFNPQGFLTSMKQEISRAHNGWTLDNIALENEVTVYTKYDIQKGPLEGVFCYGLFLDGAGWNKRQKELQEAIRKVIYTEMPVIHIYAVNSVETKPLPGYRCPLYRKPRRTGLTYISELRLETPQGISPNEWVLRGVALLCDIK